MSRFRIFRPSLAAGLVVGLCLVFAPNPASACSICRCGDPTFNALGTGVFQAGAFRLALDWERFDKEQALGEGHHEEAAAAGPVQSVVLAHEGEEHGAEAVRESAVEDRFTASLLYSFGERATVGVRIPWSQRSLVEETETGEESPEETTEDLSDPEIYGLFRLWASDFGPGLGRRTWISGLVGVKTDWGENELTEEGERIDEHLQPGTGSVDPFFGLNAVYLLDEKSALFGSAQYRATGDNDFGYEYGDLLLANFGYEHKLGSRFDLVAELNYRQADHDVVGHDGDEDPNTGGSVLYVTPKVLWNFGAKLVGRAAVQIPVAKDLNGDQTERAVFNVGLTVLF